MYNNWYYYQSQDDSELYYSTHGDFNIQKYLRKKESEYRSLKINIYHDSLCRSFDYFAKIITRLPNIKELEIQINVKLQREKQRPYSRVKEVLDFVADSLFPQFQDTLEMITFYGVHIQENSEKDEEKAIKKYFSRILPKLSNVRVISFRNTLNETSASDFFALKSFISLLLENPKLMPNLKLFDFEFKSEESTTKPKSMDQKELINIMVQIAKNLAKLSKLEELQIGIQHLGLEKNFFECLIESICKMKQLKKLGLDISENRITIENSISNLKRLQPLSSQLESFIYIDSQKFKPACLKEYNSIMKGFENLKFLQIEQLSIKKGQGYEFFSYLPSLHSLEDIRLDLESSKLSGDDYAIFAKSLKQLTNLNSLYLTLPEEGATLSQDTVECLMDIMNHFSNKLVDLSFVFYSNVDYQNALKFRNTVCEMKNLKYLYIRFPNDRCYYNSIIIDARSQNVDNIWNFSSLNFLLENYHFQNVIDLIILLRFRLLSMQNIENLNELKIIQYSFPRNKEIENEITNDISKSTKYTKLKSLINKSSAGLNFIDFNTQLINNNFSTLRNLSLSNSYSFKIEDMIKLFDKCSLLYTLDIQVETINNPSLQTIFRKLVYLQSLVINSNFFYFDRVEIDQTLFLESNYLTDFQYGQILNTHNTYKQLLQSRKMYIIQNIIYTQLILPELIYQPALSHFDMVID